jgi:hypothetical protein
MVPSCAPFSALNGATTIVPSNDPTPIVVSSEALALIGAPSKTRTNFRAILGPDSDRRAFLGPDRRAF